jgi:hypothetical protein
VNNRKSSTVVHGRRANRKERVYTPRGAKRFKVKLNDFETLRCVESEKKEASWWMPPLASYTNTREVKLNACSVD